MNRTGRSAVLRPAAIALAGLAVLGAIALTTVGANDSSAAVTSPPGAVQGAGKAASTTTIPLHAGNNGVSRHTVPAKDPATPAVSGMTAMAPAVTGAMTMTTGSAAATDDQLRGLGRPLQPIRNATAKFHNIATAEAAGYGPFTDIHGLSCIAEPGMGAMGVHYVNSKLIGNPAIDPTAPEALVYAPDRDGTLRLAALEYLVDKSTWDRTHREPPELFRGQPFATTKAPNRYGLPTFYSQHLWLWKANAAGPLAMWNPAVHCAWA